MADLTDKEFKEQIKQYDPKKPMEGIELEMMYRKLGTVENFDGFDAEMLHKATVLIESLKIPATLKDSLKTRIDEQQRKLEQNAPAPYSPEALEKMSLTELAQLHQDSRNGKIKVDNPVILDNNIYLARNKNFVRLGEEWKQSHPRDKESLEAMKLLLIAYVPGKDTENEKVLQEIRAIIAKEEAAARSGVVFDDAGVPQPEKKDAPKTDSHDLEADDFEGSKYDEMTSYDLLKLSNSLTAQLDKAIKNGEDIKSPKVVGLQNELKEIEEYAAEQMNGFMIDEDNAPAARDYLAILTAADASYDYNEQHLEECLEKYDRKYELDYDMPEAEEIIDNENAWAEITKEEQRKIDAGEFTLPPELEKDAGIQALRKEDPETLKETVNVLHTVALTELSLEEPDEDPKKAMARYHEKMEEVSTKYLTAVNLKLQAIMHSEEETNAWLDEYLKKKKMTKQQWEETQKDPEKAKAAKSDFRRYIVSNVYTLTSAAFVEKNDIFASRMAQKTGMSQTPARASALKRTWAQKHPKIVHFVKGGIKNSAWTYGLLYATGPIGLTARSAVTLTNSVITSWHNYKKSDAKSFWQYLKNNKEERFNLGKQAAMFLASGTFTAAMAASGVLTFGALGSLAGLGTTAAAQAATHTAANFTLIGLTKMQAMGGLSAVTSAGSFWYARRKLAPKKQELMALLQKYAPAEEQPVKRSLLDKIMRKPKTPVEAMYREITGTFKDLGDEPKVAAMLQQYAPNMSAQDKKAIVELAKEVQNIKAASYGAAAGVALGAGMAEAPAIARAFQGDGHEQTSPLASTDHTQEAPTENPPATSTPPQEQAQTQETEAPAPEAATPEAQPLSADKLADDTDLYKATEQGPTVIYKKLISMGVMKQEDADKIMAEEGRDYIPSRVLRNHLQDDIKMTPEQEKELNDFINDKATFKRLCDEENRLAGINHSNGGNSGHTQGGTQQAAGGNPNGTPTIVKDDKDSDAGDATTIVDKEGADPKNKVNQEAIARVTGKIKNHTGATAFLYQKHEHETTLNLSKLAERLGKKPEDLTEQDVLNAKTDAYAKTYIMEKKNIEASQLSTTNYSTTGRIVDENDVEHKIKVKNHYNENTGVQTYTRKVETEHGTERTTVNSVHHGDGTQTSFGKFKNAYLDGSTVGDADGGNDEKIAQVIDSQGNSRTFIRDGKTGDLYEVTRIKGQEEVITKSSYTESQIKSLIKHRDERLAVAMHQSRETR